MWLQLTPELLRSALADQEQAALRSVALDVDVENILEDECHNIAEMWRGQLRSTKHRVDKRLDYVPSELLEFILGHLRYTSFTRLPNMDVLLDHLREKEYDRANEIFDNLGKKKIAPPDEPEEPDDTGDPIVYPNDHEWKFR